MQDQNAMHNEDPWAELKKLETEKAPSAILNDFEESSNETLMQEIKDNIYGENNYTTQSNLYQSDSMQSLSNYQWYFSQNQKKRIQNLFNLLIYKKQKGRNCSCLLNVLNANYFLCTSPSTLPARLYSRKVTTELMPPLHRLKGIMIGTSMARTTSAGAPL